MPEDWKRALERRLADVPRGEVLIRAASGAPLFPPPSCACIRRDEKGRLDIWPLYPGVELTLQAYSAKSVAFHHDVPGAAMLEINHCASVIPAARNRRCIWARGISRSTGCIPASNR